MTSVKTRECTEVFFSSPRPEEAVVFAERTTPLKLQSRPPVFRSTDLNTAETLLILRQLQVQAAKSMKTKDCSTSSRDADPDTQYRDKVNKKRQFIAQVIESNPTWTPAAVARYTQSDFYTVKRVARDLEYSRQPSVFQYNNLKREDELSEL